MSDLTAYENDYVFDSTSSFSLESITKSMPRVVTRGATIIIEGKPQFKDLPRISCPRCGHELTRGKATIVFKYAPVETTEQQVDAWICECGESYVPGTIAKNAYHRAMSTEHGVASSSKAKPSLPLG